MNKLNILGTLLAFTLIAPFALAANGGPTGIWVGSLATQSSMPGNTGLPNSVYVSGFTEAVCTANLDAAILNYQNVISWDYCSLVGIHDYYAPQVLSAAGGLDDNVGTGGVTGQIDAAVERLESQFDLEGYQQELDILEERYGINEYKSEVIDIYKRVLRRSVR